MGKRDDKTQTDSSYNNLFSSDSFTRGSSNMDWPCDSKDSKHRHRSTSGAIARDGTVTGPSTSSPSRSSKKSLSKNTGKSGKDGKSKKGKGKKTKSESSSEESPSDESDSDDESTFKPKKSFGSHQHVTHRSKGSSAKKVKGIGRNGEVVTGSKSDREKR